jgi:uncharacterized repeat protein (TIGR03803 family)
MHSKPEFQVSLYRATSRAETVALVVAILSALTFVLTQAVQAQSFTVLYNFTGGADGGYPLAGLTMDRAGKLYGTTSFGTSAPYCGTVFSLANGNFGWVFDTLHSFAGGGDGCSPYSPVTIGPDGSLYGTTYTGGIDGVGTVFNVRPPAAACHSGSCIWAETVIYDFTGGGDGASPAYDGLVFDRAGNIYGTAHLGGYTGGHCAVYGGCGTVFQLVPTQGNWTENTLHIFMGEPDGSNPVGVILDQRGDLYGLTSGGGSGGPVVDYGYYGTVFQLTPSGNEWIEKILHNFTSGSDGGYPWAGLVFDQTGNLYGATSYGGANNFGTLFELSPEAGGWSFSAVYNFTDGPPISLVMDAAGNLYGNAMGGAYDCGFVFKLTPSSGGWAFTSLHDFSSGDGCYPQRNPTVDANGNLYGTTSEGGTGSACRYGCGVVWEITP